MQKIIHFLLFCLEGDFMHPNKASPPPPPSFDMCLIHCPITHTPHHLSARTAFISLGITWSKYRYWKHKGTKVGQDLGKHPDMYHDADQLMVLPNTQRFSHSGASTWAKSALFGQLLDEPEYRMRAYDHQKSVKEPLQQCSTYDKMVCRKSPNGSFWWLY